MGEREKEDDQRGTHRGMTRRYKVGEYHRPEGEHGSQLDFGGKGGGFLSVIVVVKNSISAGPICVG